MVSTQVNTGKYWITRKPGKDDNGLQCCTINPYILLKLLRTNAICVAELFEEGSDKPINKVAIKGLGPKWSALRVKEMLPKVDKIAEIGVQFGYNAWNMCLLFNPKEIFLVDPYQEEPDIHNGLITSETSMEAAHELLNLLPIEANWCREKSQSAYKRFPDEYFDFIYVDGDHSYEGALADLKLWYPKVRRGGIFAGDDYVQKYPGVIKAVDETFPGCEINGREWLLRKV